MDTETIDNHAAGGGPRILRAIKARADTDDGAASFAPIRPGRIPDGILIAAAVAGLVTAGLAISELSGRMALLATAEPQQE